MTEQELHAAATRLEFEETPCDGCHGEPELAANCPNCEVSGRLWYDRQGHTLSDRGLERLDRLDAEPAEVIRLPARSRR